MKKKRVVPAFLGKREAKYLTPILEDGELADLDLTTTAITRKPTAGSGLINKYAITVLAYLSDIAFNLKENQPINVDPKKVLTELGLRENHTNLKTIDTALDFITAIHVKVPTRKSIATFPITDIWHLYNPYQPREFKFSDHFFNYLKNNFFYIDHLELVTKHGLLYLVIKYKSEIARKARKPLTAKYSDLMNYSKLDKAAFSKKLKELLKDCADIMDRSGKDIVFYHPSQKGKVAKLKSKEQPKAIRKAKTDFDVVNMAIIDGQAKLLEHNQRQAIKHYENFLQAGGEDDFDGFVQFIGLTLRRDFPGIAVRGKLKQIREAIGTNPFSPDKALAKRIYGDFLLFLKRTSL